MNHPRIRAALAALLLATVATHGAQAASVTRTSAFEYDPATGLLVKEIIEPDQPQLRLETTYTYDAWGNKTAATVSSPATGTAAIAPRTSTTTYDSNGQFPVASSNALGHTETKTIDPKFGVITSLTGPNGLTTQWQYDGFGRKTREIRADGTQTQWDYLYCNGVHTGTAACPSLAKYLIQTTALAADGLTPNGPWSKTYYDALNREIRTETLGFDGSSIIVKRTEYDNLGRVARISNPHYSTQAPQWTVMTYDALDRLIATTHPDNTHSTVAYNGLTSSITNALNQTQTKVKNSQGQLIQVTDAANNSLHYQYDPLGNLVKTTDPQGNIVTLVYDLRGRKTQMIDPDMGTWTYDYNVLGELVRQTDAKGQVSTIAYDKLGRMTSRLEADLVSHWSYDTCSQGIGKLCSATADNGYSRSHSYDSLGRPLNTSATIDATYTTAVSYDAQGRIATQTYPTGFGVSYVYTSQGYLKEVRNKDSNGLYWRADTMDAEGHLLQQTYGNNIVTQQVYEAATGRLKHIYAGAGNSVQHLSYSYDSIGNLLSRNDANQNLGETFLYDNLNRLTSASVNSGGAGVVTHTYGYDSIGNITSRSDVGAYTYGAANNRPHAVTQIALASGNQRHYSYDANGSLTNDVQRDAAGNVIANTSRVHVYTSFNMPQALGASGFAIAFAYGPEHQRVKQITPSATTIYVHPNNAGGLLYEKDIKPDGSVEHKHFISAGGQVVALIKQAGSTTTANYFHRDNMGSTTAITDAGGLVIERLAYEPFGKRRFTDGSTDPNNTIAGLHTDRGYTNHEHLDELGLIHMNGRIYDPLLGRFMSADPFVQAPDNLQSYNRYSYVMNSPFMGVDPSGYFSVKSLFKARHKFLSAPTLRNTFNFIAAQPGQQQVDQYIMTHKWAYAVGQSIATYFTAICGGCGGAAWSSYYTYQGTGSMSAAVKAGAITYATTAAGTYVDGASPALVQKIVGQGIVGGVSAKLQGGKFADGAVAGMAAAGAKAYFRWLVEYDASYELSNGQAAPKNGIIVHPPGGASNMGSVFSKDPPSGFFALMASEASPVFTKITSTVPGMNAWPMLHDTWGAWFENKGLWDMPVIGPVVFNVGTMPAALGITSLALMGPSAVNLSTPPSTQWHRRASEER